MLEEARKVRDSAVNDYPYMLFPNDLNSNGTVFGGRLLEVADRLAGTIAIRHSGQVCVTLGLDGVRFENPAKQGEVINFMGAVNRVWNKSMEIGVKVVAINPATGERKAIIKMYFTFVAIGENGKPVPICQVIPETDEERRRYADADARRSLRLSSQP